MSQTKIKSQTPLVEVGYLSKREAARAISEGIRHFHSTSLGAADDHYQRSLSILKEGPSAVFEWQKEAPLHSIWVHSSQRRSECIQDIIKILKLVSRSQLRDKVALVLEELITNAIYHSYRNVDGSEKYLRKQKAHLDEKEKVQVDFGSTNRGIHLAVSDFAGTLNFQEIEKSFLRCYQSEGPSIQSKASGAGLGLYMIFETVTHLRIDNFEGQKTVISCFISEPKHWDPDFFSFNFFEWGKEWK